MEKKLQNPAVVAGLAVLACFLWGSASPAVKVGYEWFVVKGVGSQMLFAGYRFLFAGVLTFLIGCVLEKRILKMQLRSVPYVLGQGFLQTTMQYIFFYIGLANTTGSKGAIVSGTNGLWAIIFAHFMLKTEKMTKQKWLGCIMGLLGVVVVNLKPGAWGEGFISYGELMVLISTAIYGISSVTLKKISHLESPITITAYQLLFGGVVLILCGSFLGGKVTGFTGKANILFLYLALLSAVAFTIWSILLKYNPVGKVSIYLFAIPIFGVILSGIILGETILTINNLMALILVSGGVIVVNKHKKRLN